MAKRENEPIQRIHISLYEADVEWLREMYGGTFGMAKAIRQMVRSARRRMEEKIAARRQKLNLPDDAVEL